MHNHDTVSDNIALTSTLFGSSSFDGDVFNSQFDMQQLAIDILAIAVDDESEWIDWYCTETDFGRSPLCNVTINGVSHSINSPSQLYKLIKDKL